MDSRDSLEAMIAFFNSDVVAEMNVPWQTAAINVLLNSLRGSTYVNDLEFSQSHGILIIRSARTANSDLTVAVEPQKQALVVHRGKSLKELTESVSRSNGTNVAPELLVQTIYAMLEEER
ncbi:MAG: hypothetical protein R3C59_29585 [Planctomycetaceae bacterium]